MKKAVLILLIILFLGVASVSVNPAGAAEKKWDEKYPEGYKWIKPPLTFKFINTTDGHPCRDWTVAEENVARAAINEWNTTIKCYLKGNITEETDCTKSADITLRWEDEDFFKDWNTVPPTDPKYNKDWNLKGNGGFWYYGKEPLPKPAWGDYPPRDKFPLQEIYLNVKIPAPGWYVDKTPNNDADDYNKKMTPPGNVDTWKEPDPFLNWKKPGWVGGIPPDSPDKLNPAIKWTWNGYPNPANYPNGLSMVGYLYDLYTYIKHEFGHALGLIHSGIQRDVMFKEIRNGERKHLTPGDKQKFEGIYLKQCKDKDCTSERKTKLPHKSESEALTGQKFNVTVTLDIVNETSPPPNVRLWEIMPEHFTFISGTPAPTYYNTTFAEWMFYGGDVRDRNITYTVTAAEIPRIYYFDGFQESYNVTVVTIGDYEITVRTPPPGGFIVPVDKLALLAPWIVLAVSVVVVAVSVARYRRKYRGF